MSAGDEELALRQQLSQLADRNRRLRDELRSTLRRLNELAAFVGELERQALATIDRVEGRDRELAELYRFLDETR